MLQFLIVSRAFMAFWHHCPKMVLKRVDVGDWRFDNLSEFYDKSRFGDLYPFSLALLPYLE